MQLQKRSRVLAYVVVGIIVLLALLLFAPKVWTPGLGGKSEIIKIQIKDLEGALQLFHGDADRYPTAAEGLDALVRNPGLASWRGPYLPNAELPRDPWGRPYIYRCPGQHGAYDLLSRGRDGTEGGQGEDRDLTNSEMPDRR